jgi:hypothetical protein
MIKSGTLEIRAPLAECGDCRFATELSGEFYVEDGHLIWRSDRMIQPRRGPDLNGCNESWDIVHFDHVTADGKELTKAQIEMLRETDRNAMEAGL